MLMLQRSIILTAPCYRQPRQTTPLLLRLTLSFSQIIPDAEKSTTIIYKVRCKLMEKTAPIVTELAESLLDCFSTFLSIARIETLLKGLLVRCFQLLESHPVGPSFLLGYRSKHIQPLFKNHRRQLLKLEHTFILENPCS